MEIRINKLKSRAEGLALAVFLALTVARSQERRKSSRPGALFVRLVDQFLNRSMGFPGFNLTFPAPSFRQDRVVL